MQYNTCWQKITSSLKYYIAGRLDHPIYCRPARGASASSRDTIYAQASVYPCPPTGAQQRRSGWRAARRARCARHPRTIIARAPGASNPLPAHAHACLLPSMNSKRHTSCSGSWHGRPDPATADPQASCCCCGFFFIRRLPLLIDLRTISTFFAASGRCRYGLRQVTCRLLGLHLRHRRRTSQKAAFSFAAVSRISFFSVGSSVLVPVESPLCIVTTHERFQLITAVVSLRSQILYNIV